MKRTLLRRIRRLATLRNWWLLPLAGWIYGLPGFMTDGRWWLRAVDRATSYWMLGALACAALIALLAVTARPHLVRKGMRALRRVTT